MGSQPWVFYLLMSQSTVSRLDGLARTRSNLVQENLFRSKTPLICGYEMTAPRDHLMCQDEYMLTGSKMPSVMSKTDAVMNDQTLRTRGTL